MIGRRIEMLRLVGLHVPGILVSRTTPHEQQDASLRLAKRLVVHRRRGFTRQKLRQSESQKSRGPRAELPADWGRGRREVFGGREKA